MYLPPAHEFELELNARMSNFESSSFDSVEMGASDGLNS